MLPETTEYMVAENGLGAELLSGCGIVSACNENRHPCFLWVLNMLDFIILDSMGIGREVTKHSLILHLFEKLMVCEVNEPRGVVLALEDLCCPFRILPSPTHSVLQDHIHFQAYVLPEPTDSMIAENGLGAELLSG